MIEAIAAHRAAWQAFQDAPEGKPGTTEYGIAARAEIEEHDAIDALLRTMPAGNGDLTALKTHLDWYVAEEVQRRDITPEMFVLHAAINLASGTRADFVGKAEGQS